jgi:CDP-diacylglycerol--glycerol-3-phosphate 3-phosphatidyltransferase
MEQNDLEIDNLPNRLTIFRVLLIPIVVGAMFLCKDDWVSPEMVITLGWVAGWSFTLASITDFFDGYIARKRNIVTVFGSFLDPIADKFLVVSSLIMLLYLDRLNALVVIFLVLRELYMTSLRLLAQNEGVSVPVSQMGKWKTAIQMTGIPMMMANQTWWIFPFALMGKVLIYIAFILSFISAITYTLGLIKKLKDKRAERKQRKKEQEILKNMEKA